MASKSYGLLAVLTACVALGGCKMPHFGKPKAPTGQVVATVDGEEITVRDLNTELNGARTADAKQQKALQGQALQVMVNRKLLAKAAKKEGVEKTPEYAIQQKRMTETLLAESLQQKLVAAVPTPTPEEAQQYMGAHPESFAQRQVFNVDQIQARGPMTQDVIKSFEPLKTLEQVEAQLKALKVDYRRGEVAMDSLGADPRLVQAILKLPPAEVFIIPQQNGTVLFNVVRGSAVKPFQGKQASDYATQALRQQRANEAAARQMQQVIAQGASKVMFNPAYQPPAPAKPAAKPPAKAAG